MARNTQVLREALLEVAPPRVCSASTRPVKAGPVSARFRSWPKRLLGPAPQGAEFGTTEVIYLDIKQSTRDRSLALNKAVCEALDNRLRQVRVPELTV